MDNLVLIQFILPLVWIIGIFITNIDARKAKMFSLVGSILYLVYCFRLIFVQKGLDVMNTTWEVTLHNFFDLAYSMGIDGLNAVFIIINALLLLLAIIGPWFDKIKNYKQYYSLIFALAWSVNGSLMANNLFTFYVFMEISMITLFLLVGTCGGSNSRKAGYKLFINNVSGSVLMLIAIIYLSSISMKVHGNYNLTIENLKDLKLNYDGFFSPQSLVFWTFWAGLFIKAAGFPFHSWLKSTLKEVPVGVSILFVSMFVKLGIFGLIKFVLPVFPETIEANRILLMCLGVGGVLYGAALCMGQKSIKGLLAAACISHMGLVLTGIFAQNEVALSGAIFQICSHSILFAGLLLSENILYKRFNNGEIALYGGLAKEMPVFALLFFVLTMGSMHIPFTAGFPGEFVSFWGIFQENRIVAFMVAIGILAVSICFFVLFQKIMLGSERSSNRPQDLADLSVLEALPLVLLVFIMILYGIYPSGFIRIFIESVRHVFS